MPDTIGYIQELADGVGPRPASTEEEHQGAQRIAEWFSQRDVDPAIEEFNCPTWVDWPYAACYLLAFLAALIAAFHGVVGVFALVLAIIALAAFAYERYLSGSLASYTSKGLSQNVVARYVPRSGDRERRKRKVVIVAHYDSERSALEASSAIIGMYPLLQKVVLGCMVAIPVLLIVQMIPAVSGILNILWIVTCVVALVPFCAAVGIIIRRFVLRYPNGANDNASGVAAMLGAFEQIVPTGDGSQAAPRTLEEPRRHSARRAREAGVVPDDADVVYSRGLRGEGPQGDEERVSTFEHTAVSPRGKTPGLEEQAAAVAGAAVAAAPVEAIEQKLEKTAGTSEAVPRKKYKPAYEIPDSQQSPRNRSDVPEWWARVEGRRKEAQGSQDNEAVSKARSRFADLPSSDFKREDLLEKEREEAEAAAKAALASTAVDAASHGMPATQASAPSIQEAQNGAQGLGSSVAISPAYEPGTQEGLQGIPSDDDATKPQKPVAAAAKEAERPLAPRVMVQAAELQETPREAVPRPASLAGLPTLTPAVAAQAEAKPQVVPLAGETRAMPPLNRNADKPEEPAPKKIDLNSRLAHLPSLEGDDAFAGLDTSGDGVPLAKQAPKPAPLIDVPEVQAVQEPSLISNDDFGMVQPAPISSSYSDTPQGGASDNFGGSGNLEPVITRVEDSDAFSPLQAGTFSIGETGAFVPIGNTGSFSIDDAGEGDIFIADADDSSVQTKANAGDFDTPSNIDIPSSRTHKLLDSVSDFFSRDKKKNKSDKAINEWLDVDEDFEATSAGRDIGSWDNFDDTKTPAPAASASASAFDSYDYDDAVVDDGYYAEGDDVYYPDDDGDDFKWKGGGASSSDDDTHEQVARIRDSVLSQSNADLLNKEIWFVALGAGGADHAGMKAFLAAHEHELSGATFINIECVGAGELSYIESEGIGFTRTADHRLQGLLHKIARATDRDIIGRKLNWRTTDLTPALKAGFRGVTLMAFGGTAPVAWRQKDDTMAIIEPSCVEDAGNLLVEIIRNS